MTIILATCLHLPTAVCTTRRQYLLWQLYPSVRLSVTLVQDVKAYRQTILSTSSTIFFCFLTRHPKYHGEMVRPHRRLLGVV